MDNEFDFGADDSGDGKGKGLILLLLLGAAAFMLWPKKAKGEKRTVITTTDVEQQAPVVLAPATTQTYTVKSGDSYSLIAAKMYGDGTIGGANTGWKWWPYLWDVNKGVTGCDRNLIQPGQILTLPLASALPMDQQAAIFARAPKWRNPPSNCGI